jgi:tetratricopeptide (TPR) repeat protein
MVQVLFGLRYQQQLRRTRNSLLSVLEESVAAAMEAAGGIVRTGRRYIAADFDSEVTAFALDILSVLETVHDILEQARSELYGHACIVGRDIDEEAVYPLLRDFSSFRSGTGIWCDERFIERLKPYIDFEAGGKTGTYRSVAAFKVFKPLQTRNLRKHIGELLESRRENPRIILIGSEFAGLRDGLERYAEGRLGDFPPLVFRFGAGGRGVSCLADALTGGILRLLTRDNPALSDILEKDRAMLSRERLRDEFSPYLKERARAFLRNVLDAYEQAAGEQEKRPILILENIHEAEAYTLNLFLEWCSASSSRLGAGVYCSSRRETGLEAWQNAAFNLFQVKLPDDFFRPLPGTGSDAPVWIQSRDLWEFAYQVYLLRPCFPPQAMTGLFEEEGKNSFMVAKAFSVLYSAGVINSLEDPQPRIRDFEAKTDKVLGGRKKIIAGLVRTRLLAWIHDGKIEPCYNLLRILTRLGSRAGADLILDALCRDTVDGTFSSIEGEFDDSRIASVVGPELVPALFYIFKTLKVLIHGAEGQIREAFLYAPPDNVPFPRYRAYILLNLAAYQIGINDFSAASESVKEAMLLTQGGVRGLARSYRLFALVNLSQGKVSDAIDYLQFAMEYAGQDKDAEELAISSFYAACAHYILGNIAKAERLAFAAEEEALRCGLSSWAGRFRFFQARCRFETGRYREALEMFEALKGRRGFENGVQKETLDSWMMRAETYILLGGKTWPGGDGALFRIEAALLDRRYEEVLELSDRLLMELPPQDFPLIEQPDWRSGFAQCELLIIPKTEYFQRLASTYKAIALGKLGRSRGADTDLALHLMQHITKDDRFPDADPNDNFYFFSLYQIYQETKASEVDMNTAISISFNRLQKRASRIDDAETRRAFLSLNRWNRIIMDAAKEHKLI